MSLGTDEQKNKLLRDYNVWEEKYNKKGELIRTKINLTNLAELIFTELGFNFLTTIDNQEIFYYNGGFYKPNGETVIKDWTEQFLEKETTENAKREIVGYIRDKNYQNREIFNSVPHLINLQNGVYDLKQNRFIEHNPKYYFLNELPITYDKKAKIKKIKKFLEQVVSKDDVKVLQEIFGYCLYRDYFIQKAFMFIGDGANGKSTVLSLLKSMLGQHNVSGVALQDLDNDPFSISELYNKMANIYPDISDSSLHRTGKFKMLTGGDLVSANKKFKARFNFVNYAKLIFSANKLPEAKDDSNAYFRRWVLINFPNVFEGKNCDTKIFEKLQSELSGLFNWALTGLKRLLRTGAFTNSKTTDELRETYQRLASPIAAFVMDCIQINPEMYVKKDDLYSAFCEYCKKNKLPLMAKNVFSMQLHQHVRIRDYRVTISGKREQCWAGIGFNEMAGLSEMSGYSHYLIAHNAHTQEKKLQENPDNLDRFDNREENKDE